MPLISVILSTYRESESYLRASVESILSQTVTDFEFLIVLDDPHNTAATRLLTAYAQNDRRITLLPNEKNCGLVASLNRALSVARGEFIARMDADDIACPTRFEEQLRYLHRESLDITGSLTTRIDEDGHPLGTSTHTDSPSVVMAALRVAPCVPHPTWFVRREVYTALRGYRAIPRCEDYDFLLRALHHGFRIGVCPAPLLYYRIVSHGISRSALLQQHLTSRYLASQYARIDDITEDEIRQQVAHVSATQNARYQRAEQLLYAARSAHGWKRAHHLLRSLFTSRYQLRRVYDIQRLHRLRQGGK